jgi:hypothetical protein
MDEISATLIGGAIGGLLGAIGTFIATSQQSKTIANAKLRTEFIPTLHKLKPLLVASPENRSEFLEASFADHSIAIAQFRPFIGFCERAAFDRAWHTYYGYNGNKNEVDFYQYSNIAIGGDQTDVIQKSLNELAHQRILAILKYADK